MGSGHPGSYHYLIVLKATDEAQMATHSEAMLNDYLDTAPAAATLTGVYHRKLHYGWTAKSRAGGDEPTHNNFLARGLTKVEAADAEFVSRPEAFACANYGSVTGSWTKGNCVEVDDLTLYNYPEAAHTDDKRAAYASPKYPHLEAVHRFKGIKPTDDKQGFPKQFDTARFSIPARGGAGGYIVQYFWRGYRDCIDVDVVPLSTPIPPVSLAMYGIGPPIPPDLDGGGGGAVTPPPGGGGGGAVTPPVGGGGGMGAMTAMIKSNHCQYLKGSYTLHTEMGDVATCHPIPPPGATNSKGQGRDAALEACKARCQEADGCGALNVVPSAPPPSLAFSTAALQNVPWGDDPSCSPAAFAAEPAGTAVCYGFEPLDSDLETLEPYRIVSDDPQDEIFFSTCYRKQVLSGFDLLPPSGPPPPVVASPWAVGDYCLPCDALTTAAESSYWVLSDTCEMCSRANLSNVLPPPGAGELTPEEAAAAAAAAELTATIAGAAGGGAVLVCCGFLLGVLCCRRRRRSRVPPPPPDRPPEDGKLPPGWISYFDETSGAPYYINEHTQESTWTKPQAAAYAAKPKKFSIKGNRELGVLRDEVQVEMHS